MFYSNVLDHKSARLDDLILKSFRAKFKQEVMLKKMLDVFRGRQNQVVVTARIGVKGMTCKRCVATVKKALLTKAGVNHVMVDLKTGVATVTYDSNQTDVPSLHEIILRKGYFPGEAAEAA